ncbi:MAG: extracellular solute-binding protein [Chloroflexi bacterium]|nr:extracellular solute-binding protein [Chloroflexota bacterium]
MTRRRLLGLLGASALAVAAVAVRPALPVPWPGRPTITGLVPDPRQIVSESAASYGAAHGLGVDLLPWQPSPEGDARVEAALAAGEPTPDALGLGLEANAVRYGSRGWLAPLDTSVAAMARPDFAPRWLEAATDRGTLFALPARLGLGLLYYRRDLLAEANVRPPSTWAELLETAFQLRTAPELDQPRAKCACAGVPSTSLETGGVFGYLPVLGGPVEVFHHFSELLWSNGGRYLDDDGRPAFQRAEGVAALRFLTDLLQTSRTTPLGVLENDPQAIWDVFLKGKAALHRGPLHSPVEAEREGSAVRGRVGLAPLPHFPGHPSAPSLRGWGYAVNAHSRRRDEAVGLIGHLVGDGVQRRLGLEAGYLPTRLGFYAEPSVVGRYPELAVVAESLPRARLPFRHPRSGELIDLIGAELESAVLLLSSPEAALESAARQVEGVVA